MECLHDNHNDQHDLSWQAASETYIPIVCHAILSLVPYCYDLQSKSRD